MAFSDTTPSDENRESERVLNDEGAWEEEANAVIRDVAACVDHISVAQGLQSSATCIYLNLTTKEKTKHTIKLTAAGFEVCGNDHDRDDVESEAVYETPYALLNHISGGFTKAFGGELMSKLQSAQEARSREQS